MDEYYIRHRFRSALRLTPNDIREFQRPPRLRGGEHLDHMIELFNKSAGAGADLIGIESTGGKEICDEALVLADLHQIVFALGVLGARDMAFLWTHIVKACRRGGIIPSGDTACGFANTAMVLAEKKMIPSVLAAVVRVASVPRTLVAYEVGATGPSKDCAYEGPYMKAIAGVPISMEGKSSACAHLSPVGNISQAVCDCWSNESVQNVQLLSCKAPTVSLEQLAYDCRLLNTAGNASDDDGIRLRNWLADSDSRLDPQAYVLRPDVVLRVSGEIMKEHSPYARTVAAVRAATDKISRAHRLGLVDVDAREMPWLDKLKAQADTLPATEEELITEMSSGGLADKYIPEEYGISPSETPRHYQARGKVA
jgi:methanol--5-hydroxybenzimidazolylcobamide Co-methyltransferase